MNCKYFKGRFKKEEFGFAQVGIQVPDKLYDKFSDMGNCLLLKKYLIVIYLKQWKCIKKIAEKQSEEPKSYLVLKKGKRSFCKWL